MSHHLLSHKVVDKAVVFAITWNNIKSVKKLTLLYPSCRKYMVGFLFIPRVVSLQGPCSSLTVDRIALALSFCVCMSDVTQNPILCGYVEMVCENLMFTLFFVSSFIKTKLLFLWNVSLLIFINNPYTHNLARSWSIRTSLDNHTICPVQNKRAVI